MNRINPSDQMMGGGDDAHGCGDPECTHCGGKTADKPKVGDRIGIIFHSDEKEIVIGGYGTYQGEHVPPPTAGPAGLVHMEGRKNPKLVLDNGDVLWGCECWWGDEEKTKAVLDGENAKSARPVKVMDVKEFRIKALDAARSRGIEGIHMALCFAGVDVDVALKESKALVAKYIPHEKLD